MPHQRLGDLDIGTRVVLYGKYVGTGMTNIEVDRGPPSGGSTITFPATILYKDESGVLVGWSNGERAAGHSFKIENELVDMSRQSLHTTDLYKQLSLAYNSGFTRAVMVGLSVVIHSLGGEILPVKPGGGTDMAAALAKAKNAPLPPPPMGWDVYNGFTKVKRHAP